MGTRTVTNLADLARAVPKVDLHMHYTGSIPPDALVELAQGKECGIDRSRVMDAYDLASVSGVAKEEKFFESLDLVASVLQEPDDLAFGVHAATGFAARHGNLKYTEMFVNPTALMRTGMSFLQVRDGLLEGARASEEDHGVVVRFIACFLREEPTDMAEHMLDELIQYRTDEFVGVGLDGPEYLATSHPSRFAGVYDRAARAGLRRTAHFTETNSQDLVVYLDELGCERIDHGYPLMDDDAMVARFKQAGLPVTCCLTITRDILGEVDERYLRADSHPTTKMLEVEIPVSLGTDDPALVATEIGSEYALAADWWAWDSEKLKMMALSGIDASWLDDGEKREWRTRFEKEIADLIGVAECEL
jgi:adenosine deaminase